jgi:hypothetical protein
MRALSLSRFLQKPGGCAIASAASVTNYVNPEVSLKYATKIAKEYVTHDVKDGLWTGQIVRLLNHLGWKKVTVVCSDLHYLDYAWSRLSQKNLVKQLERLKCNSTGDNRAICSDLIKMLTTEYGHNKLIVDYLFPKYIKEQLSQKAPLLLSFNWTMFFKSPKFHKNRPDPIKGDFDLHCVICSGYTKTGVYVIDSHHKHYKYSLKRFQSGRYHIRWEQIMACMGMNGDLIIPECYDPEWASEL